MNHAQDEPFARESMRDYGDDPWRIEVKGIDQEYSGLDETLFALGNGYLGMRGNHEEGRPFTTHGTFVNGLHESWIIEHPESAYGFAEHGQAMIQDRKSTRLNSSHVKISYAGFCLKEKSEHRARHDP